MQSSDSKRQKIGEDQKVCNTCQLSQPLSAYNKLGNRLDTQCKTCKKDRALRYAVAHPVVLAEKICAKCGTKKPVTDYVKNSRRPDGLTTLCKSCAKDKIKVWCNTTNGFFSVMLATCKRHGKRLRTNKRKLENGPSIDRAFLKQQYDHQHGLCFYSGLPMQLKQTSDWQASPERINQHEQYSRENTVLCILELNVPTQWNKCRIVEHILLREAVVSQAEIDELLKIARDGAYVIYEIQTVSSRITDEGKESLCNTCNVWTSPSMMETEVRCKECQSRWKYRTPYSRILRMVSQSTSSTKHRNKSLDDEKQQHNTLTTTDVLDMIRNQGNRCYYSSVPLDWKLGARHWAPSLERLNTKLGYSRENCRLICRAFNATDMSVHSDPMGEGKHGWTPEKYQTFLKAVTEKYAVELQAARP